MKRPSRYILVSHGSRNKESQRSFNRLVEEIRQQLEEKAVEKILIETATLELGEYTLAEQIEKIAQKELEKTAREDLKILPLFLIPGVHVQLDIPQEIAQAQEKLGAEVNLELLPYLGSYQGLTKLVEKRFKSLNESAKLNNEQSRRLLVVHGTSLEEGKSACAAVAAQLGAIITYWSIEGHLKDTVEQLINRFKATSIDIVPYFIFKGGITQSLEEQVQALQNKYPEVKLKLSSPIGSTPELASFIVEEILK